MAIGDDAANAGLPLVPETGEDGKVKFGARELNRTRDMVGVVKQTVHPISKGGTGATTVAAARAALGIHVGSTAPSNPQQWALWFEPI